MIKGEQAFIAFKKIGGKAFIARGEKKENQVKYLKSVIEDFLYNVSIISEWQQKNKQAFIAKGKGFLAKSELEIYFYYAINRCVKKKKMQ